ncbi:MAG: hypothetical protein ACK6D3_21630 [Planctomycetaceae bacterium]
MAGVKIDSGQFPLMRNVDVKRQPERSRVYTAWINAFSYNVPDAVSHLADIIEDVYAYRLWEDKYLDTPEQFFERMGILGLDLERPAKLIRELRENKSGIRERIVERQQKEWAAKREEGQSLREIAAEAGVAPNTVKNRCATKTVITEKVAQPRTVTGYRITQYTKPTTAAAKIRATFGDDFALALGTLLVSEA